MKTKTRTKMAAGTEFRAGHEQAISTDAVTYSRHNLNKMLPAASKTDLRRLRDDISANGIKVPILLCQGKILDGWQRYKICSDLKIPPAFEEYAGDQPAMRAWSLNMARRHMAKGQLAGTAVTFMPKLEKEAKRRKLSKLKQNRNRHSKSTTTDLDALDECLPDSARGSVRSQLSKTMGVGESYIQRAKKIKAEDKALFKKLLNGEITIPQARARIYRKSETKRKDTSKVAVRKNDGRCTLHNSDLMTASIKDGSLDAIITDPPYPRENLDCWKKLGEFAAKKLKDGGILLAMSGSYHLPEVFEYLRTPNLNYYWSICYEMPNPGCLPMGRALRSNWKPVLWYVKGKYNRTFQKSDHHTDPFENCRDGKRFHKWGQSIPYFEKLVEEFTYADELVCDPFLGGGTTAIACLSKKRRFVGVELDTDAYKTSTLRIQDWEKEEIAANRIGDPINPTIPPVNQKNEISLSE